MAPNNSQFPFELSYDGRTLTITGCGPATFAKILDALKGAVALQPPSAALSSATPRAARARKPATNKTARTGPRTKPMASANAGVNGGDSIDLTGSAKEREVREWAKQHGIEVSSRGKVPAELAKQYAAAMA